MSWRPVPGKPVRSWPSIPDKGPPSKTCTLTAIPLQALDYRLGNRSALHWLIDRYRVRTDKRSGIVNEPNRLDDPQSKNLCKHIKQRVRYSVRPDRFKKTCQVLAHARDHTPVD